MSTAAFRVSAMALFLVVATTFGAPRVARAGDAGALIGGLIAGAIVYELLDDDGGYRHYSYGRHGGSYYRYPPTYYRAPGCSPGYYGGWYGAYYYDEYYPRVYTYERDYYQPRRSYKARRAPSHAQRNVGPPSRYRKHGGGRRGGKYRPPARYYK